ncbi:ubiquitin-conjugating enzyme E2 U isoform 2-T3 [Mantella aurantiaca]
MHSRAYLLLERDYEDLQEAPLYGISVRPATDSFLTWIAKIGGLKDSLWEGAALQVSLSFTEEFNDVSPTVTFNTIPFHPNVDPKTGKPCVDFLDEPSDWNPRYTMTFILLAIQTLLSNPVMEDVVNLEAADVLFNRPEVYRDMVLNCVKISRQIDGRKGRESGNQYKQTNETHITNKRYDIMIREVIDKRTEMIPSSQPGREEGSHNCVFCRLSENCGIEFLGHAEPHTSRRLDFNGDSARRFRDGEPQEEEVDQLVAWTNTLSSELLED